MFLDANKIKLSTWDGTACAVSNESMWGMKKENIAIWVFYPSLPFNLSLTLSYLLSMIQLYHNWKLHMKHLIRDSHKNKILKYSLLKTTASKLFKQGKHA